MEPNKVAEAQHEPRDWAYPSLAASGIVEIELPTLPGSPNPTERLHARNFGSHVARAVERSLHGNPYPKSGPQQGPAQVLQHYVATARGAKLLDEKTLDYLGRLSKEFAAEKGEHRRTYFKTMVSPFLNGLKPGPRQK